MKNMRYYLLGLTLFAQPLVGMQQFQKERTEESSDTVYSECESLAALHNAMKNNDNDVQAIYEIVRKHKYLASIPLAYAVENNKYKLMRWLVEMGADVGKAEDVEWRRRTSLHWAVIGENSALCQFLIERGADVNAKSALDETPLCLACEKNNFEIIKLLIEHDADINAVSEFGKTALHYAVASRSLEVCQFLIEHGADVNAISFVGGRSPLLYLFVYCHPHDNNDFEIAKLLIERGADVNKVTDSGHCSLSYLLMNYLVRYMSLESLSENPEANCDSINAAMEQLDEYKQRIVFLIKHGADVDLARNWDGEPLKDIIENKLEETNPVRQLVAEAVREKESQQLKKLQEARKKEEPLSCWWTDAQQAIERFNQLPKPTHYRNYR